MSNDVISMLLNTPCSGEQARVFAAAKAEIERLRSVIEEAAGALAPGGLYEGVRSELVAALRA